VVDGASNLLGEIFGAAGRHARSAVGVAELPRGVPVEVEFVAAIADA
jgi:enamine deaminase RidA (YjgF/YER057c/UK114 family)